MEFEIKIVHSPTAQFHYTAWAVWDGHDIACCGHTAEEAEKDMVEKLKSLKPQEPVINKTITL